MKRFLLASLIIIPMLGFTQANYHKGYVVTKSNDTLKGFIDYKERNKNPVTVNFKSDLNGSNQKFTLSNIHAYEIIGLVNFQRHVINISNGDVRTANLKINTDTSLRRDTVLLKVLQAGKHLSLFSYTDVLKERFYLLKAGGQEPEELGRVIHLADNGISIVQDNAYIRQLAAYAKTLGLGDKITDQEWSSLKYNEEGLIKIAARMNGLDESQLSETKPKGSRFFGGIGLVAAKVRYVGEHALASPDVRNKGSVLPMISLGVDLFVNPSIRRAIFRTELAFQMIKSDVSFISSDVNAISYRHTFDRMTIALIPQYLYHILNGPKIKLFAGAGAGLNFSRSGKNESIAFAQVGDEIRVVEQGLELERFNYNIFLLGGIVFQKRIEFNAGYSPNISIMNYRGYIAEMSQFRFGLNYLFGKH